MSGEANSMTLEQQLANFDPSNAEQLAALESGLLGQQGITGEPVPSDDNPAQAGENGAKPDEKKAESPADPTNGATSGTDVTTKGVQARDGQHIIPYSVLERERERAAQAEALLKEQARLIEQLRSGKTDHEADSAVAATMSEEDLVQLDQDLPGVAKVIRAQAAAIERLSGDLTKIQEQQTAQADVAAKSVEDEIEVAISARPELSAWRDAAFRQDNPDPRMWNRAADIDLALRNDPEFQDLSIADRFDRVVRTMETLYGVPTTVTTPTNTKPAADLKQVADAKIRDVSDKSVPMSLSDIPGGAPPAQTDLETLENTSALALGNRFMSMSIEQQEAFMARYGV